MALRALGVALSDVGLRRTDNEDAFFIDDDLGLYAVADGLGGHAAGEVASRTALEVFASHVERHRAELQRVTLALSPGIANTHTLPPDVLEPVQGVLEAAVELANQAVWDLSRRDPLYAGMGCTLTAVAVMGPKAAMVHVGDSRLYLTREGKLHQLSAPDIEPVPRALVGFANAQGGKDNSTAVVVRVEAGPDVDQAEAEADMRQSTDVQLTFGAVRRVFLFEDLKLSQLARVLSRCEVLAIDPGERVVREGQLLEGLLVLIAGRLLTQSGRELGPRDHLGADALLTPRTARVGVTAVEESRVLLLRRSTFAELAQAEPRLGVALLERLGRLLAAAHPEDGP